MIDFEITELHRRLANIVQLGKIVETDYTESIPRARVQVGELKTTWLPMLVHRAGTDVSTWLLEENEQVLVLSPSGDLAQAVIVGSINQEAIPSISQQAHIHRTQYADGAVIEYDRQSHALKAILPAGSTTTLESNGGITLTGDVTVNGNVQVNGNITATGDITDKTRSMQADRDIYNTHTHKGITKGSDDTLVPNEQQ